MFSSLAQRTSRLLERWGFCAEPPVEVPLPFWCPAMARRTAAIDRYARRYTMTSHERVAALCQSVAYLEANRIDGAVVECGVWKGGSMMAAALALLALGSMERALYLCDTFSGMPPPGPEDVDLFGQSAADLLCKGTPLAELVRARCGLEHVRCVLKWTRYPWEKIHFVVGRVEETLPAHAPERIALLRLDTDWYESTAHEMEHLWPRLAPGGVLIVDDYGHWQGAQRAVDEYFARLVQPPQLHVIDYTGRLVVKA
jgi:hypothetical protein